jgi:hypothetical protein
LGPVDDQRRAHRRDQTAAAARVEAKAGGEGDEGAAVLDDVGDVDAGGAGAGRCAQGEEEQQGEEEDGAVGAAVDAAAAAAGSPAPALVAAAASGSSCAREPHARLSAAAVSLPPRPCGSSAASHHCARASVEPLSRRSQRIRLSGRRGEERGKLRRRQLLRVVFT